MGIAGQREAVVDARIVAFEGQRVRRAVVALRLACGHEVERTTIGTDGWPYLARPTLRPRPAPKVSCEVCVPRLSVEASRKLRTDGGPGLLALWAHEAAGMAVGLLNARRSPGGKDRS